jgi:threonine dehydratase
MSKFHPKEFPLNIHQIIQSNRKDACSWVYEIDQATPLTPFLLDANNLWLKREDLSRIRSYKWRGAYYKLRKCLETGVHGPFVGTSAGNHAQGLAVASAQLGVHSKIFMPRTTPKLKQSSVLKQGGQYVEIELVGDRYNDTVAFAAEYAAQKGLTIIKPFDDLDIIAGQSTVGDEIYKDLPGVKYVFVPIGGGGLASGVGCSMASLSPETTVVGVEVIGQDSMRQSIDANAITRLKEVDTFCDGTAVMEPGEHTFELCRHYLKEVITVSNEEVCAAIQRLWEEHRIITEPSGAIGLAGMLKAISLERDLANHQCCAVLSGGNTDFLTLPLIVRKSQLAQPSRCYYRFEIAENKGSLIDLLDLLFEDVNIVDFQYGKSSSDRAFPVLGLYADPQQQQSMLQKLDSTFIKATDVTHETTTQFRVIPFRPDLTVNALFLHVDFPDRPGALRQLMREASPLTNICYFNFNDTGQLQGHALIGFEFNTAQGSEQLFRLLDKNQFQFRVAHLETSLGL